MRGACFLEPSGFRSSSLSDGTEGRVVHGSHHIGKWYAAYLHCQNQIPESERIPVINVTGSQFSEAEFQAFEDKVEPWILKWRPDAILTPVGSEKSFWMKWH